MTSCQVLDAGTKKGSNCFKGKVIQSKKADANDKRGCDSFSVHVLISSKLETLI